MLERGKVRLLDFGCARESSHGTNTLTIALKHGYAPIEQYTNHGQGPWTDIYALSATIYFCITGKAPVRSTDRMLGDELILPSKLGVELSRQQERALLQAMAIQPRRRFQNMEEFRAALYGAASQWDPDPPNPVPPNPVPPNPDPPNPVPPNPDPPKPVPPNPDPPNPDPPNPDPPNPVPPKPDPDSQKKKSVKSYLLGMVIFVLVALTILGIVGVLHEKQMGSDGPGPISSGQVIRGRCGSYLTWELTEETGRLEIQGSGEMYDYGNPLGGKDNLAPWYEHRDKIKSLYVGDGVKNIGSWAFGFCYNLTEAHIGNFVEYIGESAFDHSGLEKIKLNERLEEIGGNAFSGTKLSDVAFPISLRYLDHYAFEHCPNLKSVKFTSNKTRIAFNTQERPIFSDENGDIPEDFVIYGFSESVVAEYAQIMGYTFVATGQSGWGTEGQCGKNVYWYLDLDSGLLKITGTGDMYDFNGSWQMGPENENSIDPKRTMPPWEKYRDSFYAVSIGDGVTSIGENAFENCNNLQDVHWGNTVKSIGFQAFLSTALDQVILPESVSEIDQFAFNWCTDLTYVQLPESLEKLQTCAFACCYDLKTAMIGSKTKVEYSKKYGTPFNHEKGHDNEKALPENLVICSLPDSPAQVFAEEYNLPFVTGTGGFAADYEGQCGNKVWWFIDEDQRTLVLYGTYKPWIYNVPADEKYWPEEDAKVYRVWKEGGELYTTPPDFYYHRAKFDKLIILPGIIWVSDNMFQNIPIREADLGTVEEIGLNAFNGTALEKITIPETVKLIRGWSFSDCGELKEVTIPGKTRMELCVFHNTRELRYVTFGKDVKIQDDPNHGDLFNGWGDDMEDSEQIPRSPELTFLVKDKSDALRYAKEHGILYRNYD